MRSRPVVSPSDEVSLVELQPGSDTALIAFSGRWGGKGPPAFGFWKSTHHLPINRLYFIDPNDTWFHGDLPGIGPGVSSLQQHVEGILRPLGIRRVLTLGSSMGGYAAILMGALLGAEQVLAFGPQTYLNRWNRWKNLDRRSAHLKSALLRLPSVSREFLDLRKVISGRPRKPEIAIHVGLDRIDRCHARHLEGLPGVRIERHPDRRHNVARFLRDSGQLDRLIDEFVADRPPLSP